MSDNPAAPETTDFGFRRVPRAAKRGMVRAVFDSVAPRYDLMNDLMSLGIHRAWKRVLVTALDPAPRRTLLDLAAGTGDIGLAWLERGRRAGGADRCQRVDAGRGARSCAVARVDRRRLAAGRGRGAAAAAGPRGGSGVDRVRTAQLHRQGGGAGRGAARAATGRTVLLPGVFACAGGGIAAAVRRLVVPRAAAARRCVARDEASYRYLAESIRTFPDQDDVGRR